MTPAKFGYKIIFSQHGKTLPPIYAYFSDLADRNDIARVVWQHAESMLREAGSIPNQDFVDATFEERLNVDGFNIVLCTKLYRDQEDDNFVSTI